jgi:hypothetical protein
VIRLALSSCDTFALRTSFPIIGVAILQVPPGTPRNACHLVSVAHTADRPQAILTWTAWGCVARLARPDEVAYTPAPRPLRRGRRAIVAPDRVFFLRHGMTCDYAPGTSLKVVYTENEDGVMDVVSIQPGS